MDFISVVPLEYASYAISDDFVKGRVNSFLLLLHLVRTYRVILFLLNPNEWKIPKWYAY